MTARVDKQRLVRALRERLLSAMQALVASHEAAMTAAVHPEARQEHAKDMRATEASYVARGLAERVETLREGIRALELMAVRAFAEGDAVAAGALVAVEDEEGSSSLYLIAPAGGGEILEANGEAICVLTPLSPLGRVLARCREGDSVTAELPAGRTELRIVRVE